MIVIVADSISMEGSRITSIQFNYECVDILLTSTACKELDSEEVQQALNDSIPEVLQLGDWHLPYITALDWVTIGMKWGGDAVIAARKISATRCNRVSRSIDGRTPNITEDLMLYDGIGESAKEHQATPDGTEDGEGKVWSNPGLHGNFVGWIQNRKLLDELAG